MSKNVRMTTNLQAAVGRRLGTGQRPLATSGAVLAEADRIRGAIASGDEIVSPLLTAASVDAIASVVSLDLGHRLSALAGPPSFETAELLTELGEAAQRLERETLANTVEGSLRKLGALHVNRVDGDHTVGIEAVFADAVLLAAVDHDGLVTDQADASGLCGQRQTALETLLVDSSVDIVAVEIDAHDDPAGSLIAEAARHGSDLAAVVASGALDGSRVRVGRAPQVNQ